MHLTFYEIFPAVAETIGQSSAAQLLAYIGPGAGLTAIGAFLAAIAGIFVVLFGFVWYPVKRLLRLKKRSQDEEGSFRK